MAATVDITIAPPFTASTQRRQVFTYTGPSLYEAGGDALSPESLRMGKIFAVLGTITNGTLVLLVTYIASTGKLFLTVVSSGSEASGDLSTYTGRLEAVGQ